LSRSQTKIIIIIVSKHRVKNISDVYSYLNLFHYAIDFNSIKLERVEDLLLIRSTDKSTRTVDTSYTTAYAVVTRPSGRPLHAYHIYIPAFRNASPSVKELAFRSDYWQIGLAELFQSATKTYDFSLY